MGVVHQLSCPPNSYVYWTVRTGQMIQYVIIVFSHFTTSTRKDEYVVDTWCGTVYTHQLVYVCSQYCHHKNMIASVSVLYVAYSPLIQNIVFSILYISAAVNILLCVYMCIRSYICLHCTVCLYMFIHLLTIRCVFTSVQLLTFCYAFKALVIGAGHWWPMFPGEKATG